MVQYKNKIKCLKQKVYDIKVEGSSYQLTIKKINTVVVDPTKYEDLVSIQILDLIITQNFNYSLVFNLIIFLFYWKSYFLQRNFKVT